MFIWFTILTDISITPTIFIMITFNSPKQFEVLIQSMLDYDKDFINKPKKYLLNNSTDLSTTERYIELCQQYGGIKYSRDVPK